MHALRRCPSTRRLAALVQLTLFLPACTSWRVEPLAPARVVAQEPSSIRLTLPDSSHLTLANPVIQGDTLYGYHILPDLSRAEQADAIPMTQVREVAVLRLDPAKTTLLWGLGIAVVMLGALCLLSDELGCGESETIY